MKAMNMKNSLNRVVPAIVAGLFLSIPAFAQNDSVPASQSMHQAGENVEQAGSDTAAAAKDAYYGTERAAKDTTITAKVKTALERDRNVRGSGIHVDTVAGIVTLKGSVPSPERAQHAAKLAEQTEGVKSVNNQLMVITSANTD
jgi:hyperosmotically inducible protein